MDQQHSATSFSSAAGLQSALVGKLLLIVASGLVLAPAPWYLPGGASYGDDASSHLAVAVEIARHLRLGDLDLWSPVFCLGSPAGYYYGPGPHLLLGGLVALLGSWVAPTLLYKILLLLGLATLPWAVAAGARRLGLTPLAASLAGAFAPCVVSRFPFGLSLETFLHQGLFAQLPGLLLLPLALGAVLRFVRTGHGLAAALGLHALLILCHPFTGQVVALAALLAALLPAWSGGKPSAAPEGPGAGAAPDDGVGERAGAGPALAQPRWSPVLRLFVLGLLVGAATVAWWGPMRQGWAYFGGWPAGKPSQWDGTGLGPLLRALFNGSLFDRHRPPVMTLAAAVGVLAWLRLRGRRPLGAVPLLLLGLISLVLAAGRVTFGATIDYLPLHHEMELSRYLVPLHLVGILAAGQGVAVLLERLSAWVGRSSWLASRQLATAAAGGVSVLVLGLLVGLPLLERAQALPGLFRTSERYFGEQQAAATERWLAGLGGGLPGRIFAHGTTGLGTHFWMGLPAALSGRPMLFSYGAGYQDAIGAAAVEAANPLPAGAQARAVLAALGVRFVLSRQEQLRPELGPVIEREGDVLLQDLGPAPPLFLARPLGRRCARPTAYRAITASWLAQPEVSGQRPVLLDPDCADRAAPGTPTELQSWLAAQPGPPPVLGEVSETLALPSEWRARVRGVGAGELLVLGQGVHQGWTVTVDGRPARRLEVTPGYNAVALPAGDHEIVFRFRRPAWAWPLWAVLPLATLLAAGFERRRATRRAAVRRSPLPEVPAAWPVPSQ